MRIALISREYPPETGWGGIGTYVHRLAHAMAALGHDVHVIARSETLQEYARRDGAMTVHRIREHKWRFFGADLLYQQLPLSEYFYSLRVEQKVRELHAHKPFDIVEVPEYRAEGLHLARQAPVPVVVKLHIPSAILNWACAQPQTLRERLVDGRERELAQQAAAVSSPSADLARRTEVLWELPRHRITVIPNPADPALQQAEPWPEPSTAPTFLYTGRVNPMKGTHVLGEAVVSILKAIPTARFILVGTPGDKTVLGGDVPLFERVKRLWQEAGVFDRITLVGWQKDASALRAYYRQSHIVVVPSLYDNFPNVLLEAMACGRAVVASAVGGMAEVITPDADGLLVPAGDAPALAEAVIGLLRDLPQARQLGEAARRTISERLEPSRIARQTLQWYAQTIAIWRRRQECRKQVLAISTERWIQWDNDEGVAIVVPELLAGLEREGLRTHLIRRAYLPKLAGLWEIPAGIFFVLGKWFAHPVRFHLIWERYSLYGLGGWLLSVVSGKRLILNVDAPVIEEYELLQKVYFGRLRKQVARGVLWLNLKRASAIHAPSKVLADWMSRQYGILREKFHIIPNGVHLELFEAPKDRAHIRRQHGLGGEPVALFIGSLQPWHGCDLLLSAFAEVRKTHPAAQLMIAGDGKMRESLMRQAGSLKLNGNVKFLGRMPHQRIPGLLAAADVAVMPYPTLPVPFYFSPIKLFEYMGAGKAIVASCLGQIGEVLKDGETAKLVAPDSVEALAEGISGLFELGDRGAALGARARQAAQNYTWLKQGEIFAHLCRRVLERSAR